MKGSIISVQRDGSKVVCSVRGVNHEFARQLVDVQFSENAEAADWSVVCGTPEKAMEKIGNRLFDALRKHPAIDEQLFGRVISTGASKAPEAHPIYFEVETEDDDVPWEALRHSDCGFFVALDPRWAIARLQEPRTGEDASVRDFFYPLKFLVVLSSTSESQDEPTPNAVAHWEPLERTLRRAREKLSEKWQPVDQGALDVLVLTNDRSLKAQIDGSDITSWVKCELIEDEDDFLVQAAEYRPHFIHILCHGLAEGPRLILGTTKDYITGVGSIQLGPEHFSETEPITWLITLNACNSAQGGAGVHNFARSLVKIGIPAAVGMREPISTRQAALLCSDFYADVFKRVARIATNGKAEEVDWAFALRGVRTKLLAVSHETKLDDFSCRHWTIPVLYRTSESFMVRYRGMRDRDRVELSKAREEVEKARESVVKTRGQLRGGAADAMIAEYDERIAAIDKALT